MLGRVSAMPAEPSPSPLDPVRILASLPEDERADFLAAYRQALADAVDPAGFAALMRLLRLWWGHSLMAAQPGYAEALAAARRPVSGGMPLDDYARARRGG